MLSIEDVVRHYRDGGEVVRAVDGVTLELPPGEMVALHGPSGSGKTTLLLLIAALQQPDSGCIRFADRDLSTFTKDEAAEYLLHDIGFIYQSPQLMPRVAAVDNAAVKPLMAGVGMTASRKRAADWLTRVGLGEKLRRSPERLSGGERQRVAIARALAGEPRLILADEPTANLDSVKSVEMVQMLGQIAHDNGSAVLLVTHDPAAAAVADRVLTLRDGRVVGEEKPASDKRG